MKKYDKNADEVVALWESLSEQAYISLMCIKYSMAKIIRENKGVLSIEEKASLVFAQRLNMLSDGLRQQAEITIEAKKIINNGNGEHSWFR